VGELMPGDQGVPVLNPVSVILPACSETSHWQWSNGI
jgi:hypothetical protein